MDPAGRAVENGKALKGFAAGAIAASKEGDFRDWTEIRGWAAGIADALRSGS